MFLNRLSTAVVCVIVATAPTTKACGRAWQAKGGGDEPKATADKTSQPKPAIQVPEPKPLVPAGSLTYLEGLVVDEQGKPVPDARVFFHAPSPEEGKAKPLVTNVLDSKRLSVHWRLDFAGEGGKANAFSEHINA